VISLFDGIGCLLIALLALNVKVFYVAVETDKDATACLKANVSAFLSFDKVEEREYKPSLVIPVQNRVQHKLRQESLLTTAMVHGYSRSRV
jgi:predicted RNA methylase